MYLPVPPRPDPGAEPEGESAPRPIAADEEEDLRAVVGPNAAFYLASWRKLSKRPDSGTGFNRAAFVLSYAWLGYRRMYRRAFVLFAIILAEVTLEEVVFCGLLGWPAPPPLLTPVVGFTVAVVCGARANRWYLAHVRQVIAEVRNGHPHRPGDRAALADRGGTDFAGALGVVALCFMAAFLIGTIRMAPRVVFIAG
ncbi:DUF2628 domain-containing protein [Gemmata sp. G18]|uniref:DUF2628 domain-containing protein n=1 Tax=Gemmata palustris TaxID=2822762 RepID=A0ABS5BMW9_9BACT|nr:DUF2628 domain-containing protein [Gemmata palustris]MBP3955020.1 DUF2628 domain-containing protein [Gemmata palustris]